jgi:flagellar motor switch protein FliM
LTITEERGFTSNENAIIDSLCDLIFQSMREAWAPYVEIDIRPINRDINPLFANIAADDESVVVNRFALKLSDESVDPYIDVVYTYQSLNLQRDILRSRIQSQEADENWLARLRNTVSEVDFSLLVSGGHLETTVEQLSKLSEGDILSFDPPEMAEVTVNGFPLYEAQVGIKGSKVAIKIEDNILEREG